VMVIGKYVELQDAYKSIHEALEHAGIANSVKVKIHHMEAENLETPGSIEALDEMHAILVPGGFGSRGIEGKIDAIRQTRESKKPFFGICLGMQCAVIEYARNVCGLKKANSSEFDKATADPVIDLMEEQKKVQDLGGTMRLGAYPCKLTKDSKAHKAYGSELISERHRHRFEVNNSYRELLEKNGLTLSGTSPDGSLVEIVELKNHPWFVACQFHPEFKSIPLKAHPLFRDFIAAAITHRDKLEKPAKTTKTAK